MEIISYKFEDDILEDYLNFLAEQYKEDKRTKSFIKEVKKQLSKENPFFKNGKICNFLAKEENKTLGHCSAIIDYRNKETGLIGFYDCINDTEVSNNLLDRAINYLKESGCNTIRGPINLSIWHNYRFIKKNDREPEIFDPLSKDYYITLWKNKGFREASNYVSAVRTDFNYVIPYTEEGYEKILKEGYKIRNYKSAEIDLIIVLNLANKIFEGSWNYVQLTYEEFYYLYKDILPIINSEFFEIIENPKKEPVGFCFSLPNPYKKDQIILKTIGVLKEYRQMNLAAALLYSQHTKAKKLGFKEFYYPLIRVGNNVTKFPYEGYKIITEYLTFELD